MNKVMHVILPAFLVFAGLIGLLIASNGGFDASRIQAAVTQPSSIKFDERNPHRNLGMDASPSEEGWIVIDQVYQVWFNHNGDATELDQLKHVVQSLASLKYKVNSMTITSTMPRGQRIEGSNEFLSGQVPNTALIFVEK